jgi:hypothetical protein
MELISSSIFVCSSLYNSHYLSISAYFLLRFENPRLHIRTALACCYRWSWNHCWTLMLSFVMKICDKGFNVARSLKYFIAAARESLPDFICCRCMYQIVYFHAENKRLYSPFVPTLTTVTSENKYSKWVALVPPTHHCQNWPDFTSQSSFSLPTDQCWLLACLGALSHVGTLIAMNVLDNSAPSLIYQRSWTRP